MTVKEKLARQALAKIDRRLAKIKAIQEAEPLSVIMDLRKQAQALLQNDTEKGVSDNTLKALEALAKEEQKQNRLFKQQCNTKLICTFLKSREPSRTNTAKHQRPPGRA